MADACVYLMNLPPQDRHAPTGLAMTVTAVIERSEATRQSRGFAFPPTHAAHLPWIATPLRARDDGGGGRPSR